MNDDFNLNEMDAQGYIWLKMRADYTEQNERIHNAFREMAKVECKNDYTLALGKLLEYYEEDARQLLYHQMKMLEDRVERLADLVHTSQETPDDDDDGVF